MLDKIVTFLQSLGVENEKQPKLTSDDIRVATIGLCFQIMAADGEVSESERAKLVEIMRHHYGLDGAELKAFLTAGESAEHDAVDYFRFTSVLNRKLDFEQKHVLIGILWDIALADGIRHEVEEHVIWRISELLGVETRERVLARQEAEQRRTDDGEETPGSN
ncbi:TerB family tellurite resistance protein [Rhizobium sp. L1K21]|uniref:tellurite resistance TerB family protein n=1 Tax=Rhizobium sp. L1K21 TaxID=2954933 RepID=UPI002092CD97|nr:TerB family tellurite resistance protein [Rhizobium sp. L1K21]MCO6184868.1 TerB family tellurite resistance protein [Rhizobium sp. L1K21]